MSRGYLDLLDGLLDLDQRLVVRRGVGLLVQLGLELLVDLRAKAVHQHDLHAHALDHGQVLREVRQFACGNRLTRDADHKGLVAELVDVGRNRPEPGHEGEIEN